MEGIGRPQTGGPAAQAGVGIAEVLGIGLEQQQAWGQVAFKALQHGIGLLWAEGLGAHLEPERRMKLGGTPGADRQGASAASTNATAALEWISGVSSASSTQVSR